MLNRVKVKKCHKGCAMVIGKEEIFVQQLRLKNKAFKGYFGMYRQSKG